MTNIVFHKQQNALQWKNMCLFFVTIWCFYIPCRHIIWLQYKNMTKNRFSSKNIIFVLICYNQKRTVLIIRKKRRLYLKSSIILLRHTYEASDFCTRYDFPDWLYRNLWKYHIKIETCVARFNNPPGENMFIWKIVFVLLKNTIFLKFPIIHFNNNICLHKTTGAAGGRQQGRQRGRQRLQNTPKTCSEEFSNDAWGPLMSFWNGAKHSSVASSLSGPSGRIDTSTLDYTLGPLTAAIGARGPPEGRGGRRGTARKVTWALRLSKQTKNNNLQRFVPLSYSVSQLGKALFESWYKFIFVLINLFSVL